MNLKLLSTIGLFYTILLIYASLMPFDFSISIDLNKAAGHFWNYWPINPNARISGSDLISNLVLYIPMGWILLVRFRLLNKNIIFAMITTGLICSVVSIFIELLQMVTISRISSASDWLLNTISGIIGGAIGMLNGKELWINGIRWLRRSWETRPVIIVILIFAGLLMADALSPYMPTILLKQVWQSLKQSHFGIVQGFLIHPWHWWLAQRVVVYSFLTLLLADGLKIKPGLKKHIYAAWYVALFCFFLEIGKLFIVSRSFNIANVLASWAGCFSAIFIGWTLYGKLCIKKKLGLSICLIIIYMFYIAWYPFDFQIDYERMQHAVPAPIKFLPLYDYAMGATLNHARLFMQSILLCGMVVYFLRVRFEWFENSKTGMWLAALFCGLFGLLLESGQFFLASRTPSVTDIYCFAIGGGIGARIKRYPMHGLSYEQA